MKKQIVGKLLLVIFLVIFLFYFFSNIDDFKYLLEIKWYYILSIIVLKLIILFINGLYISLFLKGYKLLIPNLEAYYLSFITTWGNYFGPLQGGSGLRALYLKRKFDFPISLFLATMYGNYILVFFVNGIISLIALFIVQATVGITNNILILFFSMVTLATAMIIFVPNTSDIFIDILKSFSNRFILKIVKIFEGWLHLRKNLRLMWSLIALTLTNYVLWAMMYFLEFRAIDITLTFAQTLLFTSITSSTILVNITPGGIGIRESIQLLFSEIISVSDIDIVSVAIIDRVLLFISLLILYVIFLRSKNRFEWNNK